MNIHRRACVCAGGAHCTEIPPHRHHTLQVKKNVEIKTAGQSGVVVRPAKYKDNGGMAATGEWIEGMGTSAMLEFQRAEQEFIEAEEELLACKSRLDAAKSRVFNNPKAILHLISGILLEKFSLPVGEVGKHLQGATSRKLSLYLKETHGGLKKFIEVLTHSRTRTRSMAFHFTTPFLSPCCPSPPLAYCAIICTFPKCTGLPHRTSRNCC